MYKRGIKKRYGMQKRCVLICVSLVLVFIFMATTVSTFTYAQRKVKPEWVMPKHYPSEGFDGMGHIDRISIENGEVVISDFFFKIASYAEYNTPTEKNISGYLFKPGNWVGYTMDSTNQIISFWLIEME